MKKKSIPLVGRTTEQRLLESFLTETRRGELSCAVITGAPGSGCSALLNWFISHAQEFVVINCALEPSAKITPFAAIRMIIEQALNIYSALDIEKMTMLRGRLEPLINQVPGLLEYIHPGLHKHFSIQILSPSPFRPSSEQALLSSTLIDIATLLAAELDGLLIAVDDLHYADQQSLDVMRALLASEKAKKLFIVATADNNYARTLQELLEKDKTPGDENVFFIETGAIKENDFKTLLHNLWPDQPFSPSDIMALYDITGGLPGNLAVTVRWFTSRAHEDPRLLIETLKSNRKEIIPPQALFLSEKTNRILSFCAALGFSFSSEMLHQITREQCPEEELCRTALDEGLHSSLLVSDTDMPQTFRFRSPSVRDWYYKRLDPELAQDIHRSVINFAGEHLTQDSDRIFMLTWHMMRCGEHPQSAHCAFIAGKRAMREFAYDSALEYFTHCLENARNTPEDLALRRESLLHTAEIHMNTGNPVKAIDLLMPLYSECDSADHEEVCKLLSLSFYLKGDVQNCTLYGHEALQTMGEMFPTSPGMLRLAIIREKYRFHFARLFRITSPEKVRKMELVVFCLGTLSRAYSVTDLDRFRYCSLRISTICRRHLPDSVQEGVALAVHGATFLTRHAYKKAEHCFEKSLKLRQRLNDAWGLCQTWQLYGILRLWQARFTEAEAYLQRAVDGFTRLGEFSEARTVMMPIFDCLYQRGLLPEAEDHIRRTLILCEKNHDRCGRNIALYNLMLLHLARGQFDDAKHIAAECQKESLDQGDRYRYCLVRGAQGRIALQSGDFQTALHDLSEAAALARTFPALKNYLTDIFIYLTAAHISAGSARKTCYMHLKRAIMHTRNWKMYQSELMQVKAMYAQRFLSWRVADESCSQALKKASSFGQNLVTARLLQQRGMLQVATKDYARAMTTLAAAYAHFDRQRADHYCDSIISILENLPHSDEICERLLANVRTRTTLRLHDILCTAGSTYDQSIRIIDLCCAFLGCRTGSIYRPDPARGNPELLAANGRIGTLLPEEVLHSLRNAMYGSQNEELLDVDNCSWLVIHLPTGQHLAAAGLFNLQSKSRRLRADDIRLAGVLLFQATLLLQQTSDTVSSESLVVSGELEQKLKKVITYISQNFERDISREGLASLADIHPDYFSRMFSKYTGKKISDYINEVRINKACELLAEENPKTVIEIAFAVGFESLRTFNRAFATTTGMTPSNYRRNIQQ